MYSTGICQCSFVLEKPSVYSVVYKFRNEHIQTFRLRLEKSSKYTHQTVVVGSVVCALAIVLLVVLNVKYRFVSEERHVLNLQQINIRNSVKYDEQFVEKIEQNE